MLIFTTHYLKYYVDIHHMQDIAFSVLFAMGFVAAGVAMAIFSKDWDDIPSPASNVEDIRNSLAAGAVSYAISAG